MRSSYSREEKDLVLKILEACEDTSPVELSFGYVDSNGTCRQGIVIKNASQKVLDVIMRTESITMLQSDGLHIFIANLEPKRY
jgi:hypothetical protein